MVEKAEDTIYQRHYIPVEKLTRLLNMKDDVGWNPTMDRAIHNGADVSIGTQSEEERMQRHQIIETTDQFKAQKKRNYDFQFNGSEANTLIKDG